MKIAIIGAGPAGLSAAYKLAQNHIKVDVYEAGPRVGGMAKTIDLWGQRVDLGPHRFFSKNKDVNELWLEVIGKDYSLVDRLTRIFYNNKFYSYPLSAANAMLNLGPQKAFFCGLSYLEQKLKPTQLDGSFESWVTRQFGKHLYEIFFKPYSEKLWGISCKELDADFASQRIRKLSMAQVIRNLLPWKNKNLRTLVDQFAYPHEGTGAVYERMAQKIKDHGGRLILNCPIQTVLTENNKVIGLKTSSGEDNRYDHIISTMPLSLLVKHMPDCPKHVTEACEQLSYRNTILIYLKIDCDELFSDQWVYIQSPELQVGRITNFRNWVPTLYGQNQSTILAMEYWCYDQDPLWRAADQELIKLATQELNAIGFKAIRYLYRQNPKQLKRENLPSQSSKLLKQRMRQANILDGHVERIHRCYPVYKIGYRDHVLTIRNYLNTFEGLSVIGRYGAFKYNNQDHSIYMGILAAENLVKNTHHDLWSVNSDFEEYQESYVITKTGLNKQS